MCLRAIGKAISIVHEDTGSILGLTQCVKDWALVMSCGGRLQTQLRSGVAVAVV